MTIRNLDAAQRANALWKQVLQDFEPEPTPLSLVFLENRLLSTRIRTFVDWMADALPESLAVAG